MPDLIKAILLGVVEGVTEFLPISSTGHLVICERWLGVDLAHDPFWRLFVVFIQIGAIAAVVVYFRQRIARLLKGEARSEEGERSAPAADRALSQRPPQTHASGGVSSAAAATAVLQAPAVRSREADGLDGERSALSQRHAVLMIGVGSLPLIIAYFAHNWAEQNLASTRMIAAALAVGGALMILIEYFRPPVRVRQIEQMNWRQALGIGLAQIVAAVFPGTSRSAATIMGGELAGLSRAASAEYSFFLAIPAMAAACTFSLLKHLRDEAGLGAHHAMLLAVGTAVSFVVAWAVIAAFMSFIRRHSFVPFAIYRIGLAIVVLLVFR